MTEQQIDDFIRQKCIEANPEIVELKKDCELLDLETNKKAVIIGKSLFFGDEGDYNFNIIIFQDKAKDVFMWQDYGDRLVSKEYKDLDTPVDFKILGRDLTLADVLMAIEENLSGGEINYNTYGQIFHIGKYEKPGRNGYYSKCFWDLSKPYQTQTLEVKEFIYNLLK